MSELLNYRGIVLSKYKSISDFAKAIGWSRNKASRILNCKQEPDSQDIIDLTKLLKIPSQEEFFAIFFAELSTMWTDSKKSA